MPKPYRDESLQEIEIVNLQLDTENYRTGPQPGQHEAIQAMIDEQQEKLVELAEDIVKNGLSPIELLAVCPSDQQGKYRVVEGNRRLTAFKLLNTPALAANTQIEKPIQRIATKAAGKISEYCVCRVFARKQEALVWIQRRHNLGLGGAATVPWSAIQNRRAQEDEGYRQNTLEVIDFVQKNAKLSSDEEEELKQMSVTNLERILEDPLALSILGIEVRTGELVCKYDRAWTLAVLKRIVTEIAAKHVKVANLYDANGRKRYVEGIVAEEKQRPNKSAEWSIVKSGAVSKPQTPPAPAPVRSVPVQRKTLIPTSCVLHINQPRLNEIYIELRKKLNVSTVPNSVAVMFRVFVEFSADLYIAKNKIPCKDDKLVTKLRTVADFMQTNNIMTEKELKSIRLAIGNPHDLLSTNTLNAYVHNMTVMPNPTDLRRSWDSIQPFVQKLWK